MMTKTPPRKISNYEIKPSSYVGSKSLLAIGTLIALASIAPLTFTFQSDKLNIKQQSQTHAIFRKAVVSSYKYDDGHQDDNDVSSSPRGGRKPRAIYILEPAYSLTKVQRVLQSTSSTSLRDNISKVGPSERRLVPSNIEGNSKDYRHQIMRGSQNEECQPWQEGKAILNCNVIHEFELGQLSSPSGRRMARGKLRSRREADGIGFVKYLSSGDWRDVWMLSHRNVVLDSSSSSLPSKKNEELAALKTLRYEHDFSDSNYVWHRRDALASERLSSSPYVVDIFAFCQNTAMFEYGAGGDIGERLWPYDEEVGQHIIANLSSWEKLEMAYQVACGIADIHDADEGTASIAHTNIKPSQFISVDGKWKVNNFNRCRFFGEYKEDKSGCGLEVGSNLGIFRATEEYAHEIETEKIDVYSMGNVFYAILSGAMPFEGIKTNTAQELVKNGNRKIPDEIEKSEDTATQAILAATKACWIQDPNARPPATAIRDELKSSMDRIQLRRQLRHQMREGRTLLLQRRRQSK